jgi:hypothetical protein
VYVYPFVLFLLAIVLSVLGYTDYDYSFGIFKLFLEKTEAAIKNGQSRETGKIRYTKHMTTKNVPYEITCIKYYLKEHQKISRRLWNNKKTS